MSEDLISAFKSLKPLVQIVIVLTLAIVALAVLKNAAPAVSIITALLGGAGYVQAKRNSQIITTLTNRLNAVTPEKTFDPKEIELAATNGKSANYQPSPREILQAQSAPHGKDNPNV